MQHGNYQTIKLRVNKKNKLRLALKKPESSFLILDFEETKNDKYSRNFLKLLR